MILHRDIQRKLFFFQNSRDLSGRSYELDEQLNYCLPSIVSRDLHKFAGCKT